MKKTIIIAVLATIMTLALVLSGCAKTDVENLIDDMVSDIGETAEDIQDTNDSDGSSDIADDSSDMADNGSVTTDPTPAGAYQRFLDAKTVGYDAMTARIEENSELSMTAGMQLLTIALIDLQVIDLVFVTGDSAASETAAAMMGLSDLNVQYTGEDFGVTFTGADSGKYSSSGKYDAASDSLTCVWSKDGSETLMLEFVKYGEGYAAQYYITGDDGVSIIKLIVDGADIAIGMGDVQARPSSIYKAAPADFTFVDDCASVYVIVDGQGSGTVDGAEVQF